MDEAYFRAVEYMRILRAQLGANHPRVKQANLACAYCKRNARIAGFKVQPMTPWQQAEIEHAIVR